MLDRFIAWFEWVSIFYYFSEIQIVDDFANKNFFQAKIQIEILHNTCHLPPAFVLKYIVAYCLQTSFGP